MASSYTTGLKIEKPGNNEQQGSWGTTANTDFDLIDEAVSGVYAATVTTANISLTFSNTPLQSQNGRKAVIRMTGASTGQRTITVNATPKVFIVDNATTGGYDHILSVGSGTTITIPNGKAMLVYTDGTNFYSAITYVSGYVKDTGHTMAGALVLPSNGLTAGTNQLVISGGNVGVGTASPAYKLDVSGTLNASGAATLASLTVSGTAALNGAITLGDTSGDAITVNGTPNFLAAATMASLTVTGAVALNGNTTLGNASGDTVTVTGTATFAEFATLSTGVKVVAGGAGSPPITCTTDTNSGIYFAGSDIVGISTGGTSRLVVDASGRLGVGRTPTTDLFEVAGDLLQIGSTPKQTLYDSAAGANAKRAYMKSDNGFHVGFGSDDGVTTQKFYDVTRSTHSAVTQTFYVGSTATAWIDASGVSWLPGASVTPSTNGQLMIQATSNSMLTFKLKGSDGTVRSGTLALA